MSGRHVGHCIEESVYPIDADDAALRRVAVDPPALADLIEGYDAGAERGNLAIIILAVNSD